MYMYYMSVSIADVVEYLYPGKCIYMFHLVIDTESLGILLVALTYNK